MAENTPRKKRPPPAASEGKQPDRFPTHEELLADLSPYGAKRRRPQETPAISRRTRDYLLTAGIGSAVIGAGLFKLMTASDGITIARITLTAIALFCGLLWYIFYGVMSRY